MTVSRRAALAAPALLLANAARAQAPWPTRPLTLIAPFTPGGQADLASRPLAAALDKQKAAASGKA